MIRSHARRLVVATAARSAAAAAGGNHRRRRRRNRRLSTLVLAQTHPEQSVALRCTRTMQRRCVKSGDRTRTVLLLRPRGGHASATTLARGQLTAVVFNFQYLQLKESQGLYVLHACKPKKKRIQF